MPQPTEQVRQAIQLLHEAMLVEPEPDDKATIAQCLTALTRLQAKNMRESSGGVSGGQAVANAPGAQAPPPPPGYAQALLSRLSG